VEALPFILPESLAPLSSLRERLPEGLRLPAISDVPLPLVAAGRFLHDLVRETGDEAVAFAAGAAAGFEQVPLGRHVANSLTVGAALSSAVQAASRFCGGHRMSLELRGPQAVLERHHSDLLRHGRRQANDYALQLLIGVIRRGAGPSWRPTELHLEGAPPGHAEQLAALATRATHFGATADRLVFSAHVLAQPLRRVRSLDRPSTPLPEMDFVESIRLAIRYLLELDDLHIAAVADLAGTSVRSLQRRLGESGFQYARLVDEARFALASELLRQPALRIIDISVGLGYRDAANFTRAFRRWSGVAPAAFRRAMAYRKAHGDRGLAS